MSNIQPYIILNGTDSRSISGLLISSLPPISKPQVRTQIETVDGRDGDIVTPLGFSAYDKVIKIGLTYNYDVDEIIEFFNSEGIVTFSNEPDKYYRYAIYEQIDFEKLIKFKTAEVTLHVQPFKFSTTEDPELFDVVSGQAIAVTNEGNTDSRPNLTIIGSGDIDVSLNGSQILSIELEDDQAVIIDSEDMNAYAAQSAIREVVADIEPEFDTNGYGSVWIGGAGKNKLNCTATTQTTNGVTVTVIKNSKNQVTQINVSGTATAGVSFTLGTATIEAGTYVLNGYTGGSNVGTKYINYSGIANAYGSNVTSTISETKTTTVSLQIANGAETGFTIYPMIRLSNTSSDFEPYENIGEISGSTELNVTLCGKNLFKKGITNSANGVTFKVNDDGSISLSGTATNTAFFIAFENLKLPNGVYTLSGGYSPTIAIYIRGTSSGANILSSTGSSSTGNINTGIITGLIRIQSGTNTNGITLYPQLEIGSQATDIEDYIGETYNIPFEQTVYGGSLNVTTGELTIDKGFDIINGSVNWSMGTTARFRYFDANVLSNNSISWSTNVLSNMFAQQGEYPYAQIGGGARTLRLAFDINDTSITSVEQLKALLNQTPLQVVYPLATPTEIQLTPTQINNLLGVNNMYSDTGDITVKHKSNGVIVTDTGDIVSFYAGLDDIEKGVLLNRAITGDYDKIRLRKGVNTFVLTGNARQFAIDKFSRWI